MTSSLLLTKSPKSFITFVSLLCLFCLLLHRTQTHTHTHTHTHTGAGRQFEVSGGCESEVVGGFVSGGCGPQAQLQDTGEDEEKEEEEE